MIADWVAAAAAVTIHRSSSNCCFNGLASFCVEWTFFSFLLSRAAIHLLAPREKRIYITSWGPLYLSCARAHLLHLPWLMQHDNYYQLSLSLSWSKSKTAFPAFFFSYFERLLFIFFLIINWVLWNV